MSKVLQTKIDELFEATKDLMSLEEIKPHCEKFNEWVNQQSIKRSSLGSQFSRYGLYSKFRAIPLEQGKNADSVEKRKADGSVKGHELKHYVPLMCGLDNEQWQERNQSSKVFDRLENSTEIDPDTYLEVTGKLLNSADPHELAVGIIAATGRRPHEVIARAKFSPIDEKTYHVMFEGQGKKRGEKPVFEIATLYPADFVIKCLARLRRDAGTKKLLMEVEAEFPQSVTQQNTAIDDRRGNSLRRVVREYFGDKGTDNPILNFRHGEEQNNNTALRAAYAVLATNRDCRGSDGAKILHASRLLGHFVEASDDLNKDGKLNHLATTVGYSDYFVTKPVPFPTLAAKEKPSQVRVFPADYEEIRKLQDFWRLPNQQSVVAKLLKLQEKNMELGRLLQEKSMQLSEAKERINQLEKQSNGDVMNSEKTREEVAVSKPIEVAVSKPSEVGVDKSSGVEGRVDAIEKTLAHVVALLEKGAVAIANPVNTLQPETKSAPKPEKVMVDWESKTNAELWATKAQGSAVEKIRRSYEAICLYNNTVATGDEDRLAITNQGLREMSGVNGLTVGDWIKAHADEIIAHHSKYGMQPVDVNGNPALDKQTGEVRTDSYYNKRHGQEKVAKLMALVNEKFLEGVAKS